MPKIPSLQEYLQAEGVDDTFPPEKIEAMKKAYWKVYHQLYYEERKKEQHRFTMRLNRTEQKQFTKHKKQYAGRSLSTFIKECALGYLENIYVPYDQEAGDTLSKAIKKIGNTINQVVQSIHRTAKRDRLTGALAEVKTLEKLQREYTFLGS